jgi:hypothetical protein
MTSKFIDDMIDVSWSADSAPAMPHGRFTAVNKTMMHVDKGDRDYRAQLEVSADFQMCGRRKRCEINDHYTNFSGYNKKYITDVGTFDAMAALEEFSRVTIEKRLVKEDTYTLLSQQVQADSHEAFIYNMLISWLKAKMYRESGGKDDVFTVKTSPYKDSHSIYALDGIDEDRDHLISIGFPVDDDMISDNHWVLRTRDNYWSRPFVLHYNAAGQYQEQFYLLHVFGRNQVTSLNFDVALPSLDTRSLLLDPVNGRGSLPSGFDSIPWGSPDMIWTWIMDYVRLNRVEQGFAAAMEALGAMAVHPTFPTLEACVWQKAQLVVVLGQFSPTRGRIRTILEGEPYVPFAAAPEFVIAEGKAPARFITASAVMNYYMWYGLYAIIHNEANTRHDWRSTFSSISEELRALVSPTARACAVSAITGREYSTCMSYGSAFFVDTKDMDNVTELKNVTALDGTVGTSVPIDAVYAPVSGSLIAGTLAGDLEVIQHLKALQTVKTEGQRGMHYDKVALLKLSSMYRMFGYDTTLRDNHSRAERTVWAAARECVVEPASLGFDPTNMTSWSLERVVQRPGRHCDLPSLPSILHPGEVRMSYDRPMINITNWQTRANTLRPIVTLAKKQAVHFLVKAPLEYNSVAFTTRKGTVPTKLKDFHTVITEAPPMKPEGRKITETMTMDSASTGEHSETVTFAESNS